MFSNYNVVFLIIIASIILSYYAKKTLENYFKNLIYKNPDYLSNLIQLKEFLKEIESFNDYVNWVKKKEVSGAYANIRKFFKNKSNYYREEPLVKKFNEIYENFDEFIDEYNNSFVNSQKEKLKLFFGDIENKSLDEQQKNAIIVDEYSNLVIAGAGSGKTLTIIGKIKYLLEDRRIKPEQILLLSFTRKTVSELNERLLKLNIEPVAKSFHKLGYDIIKSQSQKTPGVPNENILLNVISEFLINEASKDEKISNAYIEYLGCYMNIPKEMEQFDSLGDKIEDEKGINFETLKSRQNIKDISNKNNLNTIQGERVKSIEELTIANFLFLNGIKYKYEKKYPHTDYNYQPDFYLTEYNIYLEHFGVDESNRAGWLSPVKEKEYVDGMLKKKELHKQHKTKLICTYSYFNKENLLKDKLSELLENNGVKLQEINVKKVYEKIKQNDQNFGNELNRLIISFINLCKSRNLDKDSIISLYKEISLNQSAFFNERQNLFLKFAIPIFEKYNDVLKKENEIDFNDMINTATQSIISNDVNFEYKYIIVDEYQDVSFSRFNLIKTIRDRTKATIMCVGDDWQSIYRFAGSDISLFTNFESYFGKSERLLIEKTYRNSQNLIDISKNFILKNKSQISKSPTSEKENIIHPIKFVYYNDKLEEEFINQIKLFLKKYGNKPILVLGRHYHDLEDLISMSYNKKIKYEKNRGKIKIKGIDNVEISFLTIHSSKGIEADNVVILNLKNHITGFPNKLTDDRILKPLMSSPEEYRYSEERRLFYVALTRTKNEVVLMINNSESEFVSELIKDNNEIILKNLGNKTVNCVYCKKGVLEIRINKSDNSKFLGCSNYPICSETVNDISVLENPRVCPKCSSGFQVEREGKRGKFWGCTNYPYCK